MKIDDDGNLIHDIEIITMKDLEDIKRAIDESESSLGNPTLMMSPEDKDSLNKTMFNTSRIMGTTPNELKDYTIKEIYGIPIIETKFVTNGKMCLMGDNGYRIINR